MARGSAIYIGGDEVSYPVDFPFAEVYIKKTWSDEWERAPYLHFQEANAPIACRGVGECILYRHYGDKKEIHDTDYSTYGSLDLRNYWVRIDLSDNANLTQTIWVGRIYGQPREMWGDDVAPSGFQRFVAYQPVWELRRKFYYKSYWVDGDELVTMGWIPIFNQRDSKNMLVGNRTADRYDNVHHFGGVDVWSRIQMLEYILTNIVEEEDGPKWFVGGQTKLLEDTKDTYDPGKVGNAGDDLDYFVADKKGDGYGFEYDILPKLDDDGDIIGFSIEVMSKAPFDISFGEDEDEDNIYTLPGNPGNVYIHVGNNNDILETHLEESENIKYNSIRLQGERIRVCMTLYGKNDNTGAERVTTDETGTQVPVWNLEGKWGSDVDDDYNSPSLGESDPGTADKIRRDRTIYHPVYKVFAAKDDWGYAGPVLDSYGNVISTGASYQRLIRETFNELPLKEGYNYNAVPAENKNDTNYIPEFQPILVWIWDEDEERYVRIEKKHAHIYSLDNNIGVYLHTPIHYLGKNHFTGDSLQNPKFDHEQLVITLSFPTDHRLSIHDKLDPDGEESELIIQVDGAELWYLAALTAVDTDDYGALIDSGHQGRVLRNDAERLVPLLCAAKARYHTSRNFGTIIEKGWSPWQTGLGHMVSIYEDEGKTKDLHTPLTEVKWTSDGNTELVIGDG